MRKNGRDLGFLKLLYMKLKAERNSELCPLGGWFYPSVSYVSFMLCVPCGIYLVPTLQVDDTFSAAPNASVREAGSRQKSTRYKYLCTTRVQNIQPHLNPSKPEPLPWITQMMLPSMLNCFFIPPFLLPNCCKPSSHFFGLSRHPHHVSSVFSAL